MLPTDAGDVAARGAGLEAFWPGRRGDAFDELCPPARRRDR